MAKPSTLNDPSRSAARGGAPRPWAVWTLALLGGACSGKDPSPRPPDAGADPTPAATQRRDIDGVPVLGYEVVATYPHDEDAYTQGLLILDGALYESTGQRGSSTVRRVDLATGVPELSRDLDARHFGEGLAAVGGMLYQLTWTSGRCLVWRRDRLVPAGYTYDYPGEGWGLTTMGDELVMSDGTAELRFLDPKGFQEKRRVLVTAAGRPVIQLNELEYIDGEIWANVWKSDLVARIDPSTGEVLAWVDLSGILGSRRVGSPLEDVLNGIAHDPDTGKLYVTGKRWPLLFEIRVEER